MTVSLQLVSQRFCLLLRLATSWLAVAFLLSTSAAEPAYLSGKILDPQGEPVTKAHVKLRNPAAVVIGETTSDTQGNFAMEGLAPGPYKLRAESESFVTVVQDISVTEGEMKQITLQLQQLVSVLQVITVVSSAPSVLM